MPPRDPLGTNGFVIHREVLREDELLPLRSETSRIATETGNACVRQLLSKSRALTRLAHSEKLQNLLPASTRALHPVRSILFDKTPDTNRPVAWHRDLTIAVESRPDIDLPAYGPWSIKSGIPHVQPPLSMLQRMVTLRIHLDPTPEGNGALHVIPGSHRVPLQEAAGLPNSIGSTCCECQPGDVLAMSPLILHASNRSTSASHRRVIHIEFAPLDSLEAPLVWKEA